MKKKIILLGASLVLAFSMASCTKDGPAQEISGITEIQSSTTDIQPSTTEVISSTTTETSSTVETTTVIPTKDPMPIPNIDTIPMDNADFDDFMKEIFIESYVGDDAEFWNVFAVNPANLGYERSEDYVPKLSVYDYEDMYDTQEVYENCEEVLAKMKGFNYDELTDIQKSTYDITYFTYYKLDELYNPYNEFEYLIMSSSIDQFGGDVAGFAGTIENYQIRNEQDVRDMISYTNSTQEAFESYLLYTADRVKYGYPLSDFTIDEMIGYLEEIETDGDDYYLFDLVKNNINQSPVSDLIKESLITELTTALKDVFMPAVSNLADGLVEYKGKNTSSEIGYLGQYGEKGKQIYKWKVENLLGYYSIDLDAFIKEIDTALTTYKKNLTSAITKYQNGTTEVQSDFMSHYNGEKFFSTETDPEKIMEFLMDYAKELVPELEHMPIIEYKWMDETVAERTTTSAYYIKGALDDFSKERITINPNQLEDTDELLFTIAHEGYPGHLYNFVLVRELGIGSIAYVSGCTAFAEGWTKYVEYKLYDYLTENGSKGEKIYASFMKNNSVLSYLVYTRVDLGINYQGWGATQVKTELNKWGFGVDNYEEMSQILSEEPSSYIAYGYGQYKMIELHNTAKTKLGSKYDEKDLNYYILSKGLIGIEKLESAVNTYIAEKKAQ